MFVSDMYNMYWKYCDLKGLTTSLLYKSDGKIGFKVTGKDAAKYFKHEGGKHVVQRCPPTENKGRRHTSTISVSVLPVVIEEEFVLKTKDIRVDTLRGSGAGGQHKNKTDSCVRMVHLPTKIAAVVDGRDQHANRREARAVLESRVAAKTRSVLQSEQHKTKHDQVDGGGRGNKVRTYNFLDSRVVDHRLGLKTSKLKLIMRGQLDLLFQGAGR